MGDAMKLIIAGSRHLDEKFVCDILISLRNEGGEILEATEIVSGTARGADGAGEKYASLYGIPVKRFPADWNTYGRAAGPIRNREMAEYADALLLIWDGKSRGSANMKGEMERRSKNVFEIIIGDDGPEN